MNNPFVEFNILRKAKRNCFWDPSFCCDYIRVSEKNETDEKTLYNEIKLMLKGLQT